MIVKFNIFKNNLVWDASIHQLNRDILLRHVLAQGHLETHQVDFSYCEETCQGYVLDTEQKAIGMFSVF